MKSGIFLWFEWRKTFSEIPVVDGKSAMLWKLGGSALSDKSHRAEHDGMNCRALSQASDQTLDRLQEAERVLATAPLELLQQRSMARSSDAW